MSSDQQIFDSINELVQEEHALRAGPEHEGHSAADSAARLRRIEVELDRCWDLLRQRQALRNAGKDPDAAHLRSPEQVEGYSG